MEALLRAGNPITDIYADVMRFVTAIVQETEAYDAVEFHQLSHYTGVEGAVKWMRGLLEQLGVDKEIFVGDALSGPTLYHLGPFEGWEYDDGARLLEVVGSRENLYGYRHAEVESWYRGVPARYTAKQALLAVSSTSFRAATSPGRRSSETGRRSVPSSIRGAGPAAVDPGRLRQR